MFGASSVGWRRWGEETRKINGMGFKTLLQIGVFFFFLFRYEIGADDHNLVCRRDVITRQ